MECQGSIKNPSVQVRLSNTNTRRSQLRSVSNHRATWRLMEVPLEAIGGARSVFVVMVSVPVLFAHDSRFVRALFIAHVGFARRRIHCEDARRSNRTP